MGKIIGWILTFLGGIATLYWMSISFAFSIGFVGFEEVLPHQIERFFFSMKFVCIPILILGIYLIRKQRIKTIDSGKQDSAVIIYDNTKTNIYNRFLKLTRRKEIFLSLLSLSLILATILVVKITNGESGNVPLSVLHVLLTIPDIFSVLLIFLTFGLMGCAPIPHGGCFILGMDAGERFSSLGIIGIIVYLVYLYFLAILIDYVWNLFSEGILTLKRVGWILIISGGIGILYVIRSIYLQFKCYKFEEYVICGALKFHVVLLSFSVPILIIGIYLIYKQHKS